MKKIVFLFAMLFAVLINTNTAGAKEKFLYEYTVQKEGTWITKITPLSSKGISKLVIPKKLGGKKVVKLGGEADSFFEGDWNGKEPVLNIFGVHYTEEDVLYPGDVQELVKKIKKIVLPDTIKSISKNCFSNVPDGKILNIPKGVVENLDGRYGFTNIKWKKLSIDSKNKKYKVKNGCLLSRNGKKLYGFVQKKKKITIPEGVKTIVDGGDFNGSSQIVIPKSVTKIKNDALTVIKPATIKISSKNKHYAVKNGSIYSKISGRLVSGYINKAGVLNIPEKVTTVYYNGWLGNATKLKKVIVPASVTGIAFCTQIYRDENMTFIFKGTNPPKLLDLPALPLLFDKSTIYVPANCKSIYLKVWNVLQKNNISFTMIEQ